MYFSIIKIVFSVIFILGLTAISQKFPKLAGFLVTIPTMSLLTLVFSHIQYKESFDVVKYYKGILIGLPGYVLFFAPFMFIKNFYLALAIGFIILGLICILFEYYKLI